MMNSMLNEPENLFGHCSLTWRVRWPEASIVNRAFLLQQPSSWQMLSFEGEQGVLWRIELGIGPYPTIVAALAPAILAQTGKLQNFRPMPCSLNKTIEILLMWHLLHFYQQLIFYLSLAKVSDKNSFRAN